LEPGGRVAVLGLSYKPETHVVEESQGVALARALTQRGFVVAVHDPQAVDAARAVLGRTVHAALDPVAAVEFADLVIIMTAWSDYEVLPSWAFQRAGHCIPVIDCWNVLEPNRFPGIEIIRLGAGAMVAEREQVGTSGAVAQS
jgi:UDPglucose 6-dehydrogenase